MNIVSIADAKARLSAYIRESEEKGPVIITRNGRPAAVLLPVLDEEDLERLLLAYNPKFRQLIEEADNRIQETGGISHEEFWEGIEEVNG
jgi:prevent-host-death family protein